MGKVRVGGNRRQSLRSWGSRSSRLTYRGALVLAAAFALMPSSSALAAPPAAATPGFMQADSISALNSLQQLSATAAVVPSGFQESVVFSGLTNPTAVRFASDGRVFVAEKSGLVKVFDSLNATARRS